ATRLTIVLLPAPFSPTSACTVPGCSSKSTSSSATTPGKVLRTWRRARSGGAVTSLAGCGIRSGLRATAAVGRDFDAAYVRENRHRHDRGRRLAMEVVVDGGDRQLADLLWVLRHIAVQATLVDAELGFGREVVADDLNAIPFACGFDGC